jgi:uncharacterized repeat protein (TIGR03803 family)
MDKKGNIYGTALAGGSADVGTVFNLDTAGNETVLHTFTNTPDGAQPRGALAMDKMGNLYGTLIRADLSVMALCLRWTPLARRP